MAKNRKSTAAARREAKIRQERQKKLMLFGGIAAVVLLVVGLAVLTGGDDRIGVTEAAAWDLPVLDEDLDEGGDGRVTLAEFEGSPLVVNFFASWCVSCEREMPIFRAADERFGDDLEIIYVNSNETGNWRPMVERAGLIDDTLIADIQGSNGNGLYRAFGGTGGMPLTVFYDEAGDILEIVPGEMNAQTLTARLSQFYGLSL